MKREKPMTVTEFYNRIWDILKKKGFVPDILDYSLAEKEPVPITTYRFDIKNNLDYGSSEGIYLDLWIEWREKCCIRKVSLGTVKTLETGREAMRIMAQLLADFIVEARMYVDDHLDDFTWEGFDVYACNEKGGTAAMGIFLP